MIKRGGAIGFMAMMIVALAGCGGLRQDPDLTIANMTPDQLRQKDSGLLCAVATRYYTTGLTTELSRRDLLRERYGREIIAQKVALGMTWCEAEMAWGLPAAVSRDVVDSKNIMIMKWVGRNDINRKVTESVTLSDDVVVRIEKTEEGHTTVIK